MLRGETLVTGKITYDGAADKCLVHHGAGGGVCLGAELPLLIGVGREKRWLHVSVESIDKGIAVGMAELMDKDGENCRPVVYYMAVLILGTAHDGGQQQCAVSKV